MKETNAESIIRSLVKVRLMICCWNGKTISDSLSEEVAAQKKADKGSVDAIVAYLPDRYATPITVAASRLRTYWNASTLPWDNDSSRVVTSKGYQSLMDGATQRKIAFDEAVTNIVDNYDEVLEASKVRLGVLFAANKFPSQSQLKDKYGVFIYRDSIHAADDVRIIGLEEGTINDIRSDVSKQYETQVQDAVANVIARLREVTVDVNERMSKPVEGLKFATLLTKINKTADSLEGLNITNDDKITKLINKLHNLGSVDVKEVRESATIRKDMQQQAKDITDALDSFKE